jgi:hypothetical protein
LSDQLKTRDPKDPIKAIAMNIGKNVACYIETMYPEAVKAASSTFLLALRNDIYNEIMEAVTSEQDMQETLERHRKFRRAQRAAYKRIRAVCLAAPGKTRE